MFYSIIIPLYNRPDEIKELLESLQLQTYKNFEVVVVEDGSLVKSEDIVKNFSGKLNVRYYYKEPNSGAGFTRNYGFNLAKGDYFIVFDSDCIIPPDYLAIVDAHMKTDYLDSYGGPDMAHENFTPVQKAINYSMTSYFTTGGIRGRKKHVGSFHPRSFNMGISRAVYEKIGGFKLPAPGEDLEYSIRIIKSGFKTGLIEKAFVYHKRRVDFIKFFKQARFFGQGRINVYVFFKEEVKLIHFFPAIFAAYFFMCILALLFAGKWSLFFILPLLIYSVTLFIDASIKNRSVKIGFLSLVSAYVQLNAYGLGFTTDFIKRIILKKK
jgi:glycosyltransferase involved in cell wall biosynthesis